MKPAGNYPVQIITERIHLQTNPTMKPTVLLASVIWVIFSGNLSANGALNLIPEKLVNSEGEVLKPDLIGKYVGLYFSAYWCPPCRFFSPELVKFRNQHKDYFEVVYVSSDVSEKEQLKYMKKMKAEFGSIPWETEEAAKLASAFHIEFLPTLVILSPNGELVTMDGRGDITRMKDAALKHWQSTQSRVR